MNNRSFPWAPIQSITLLYLILYRYISHCSINLSLQPNFHSLSHLHSFSPDSPPLFIHYHCSIYHLIHFFCSLPSFPLVSCLLYLSFLLYFSCLPCLFFLLFLYLSFYYLYLSFYFYLLIFTNIKKKPLRKFTWNDFFRLQIMNHRLLLGNILGFFSLFFFYYYLLSLILIFFYHFYLFYQILASISL